MKARCHCAQLLVTIFHSFNTGIENTISTYEWQETFVFMRNKHLPNWNYLTYLAFILQFILSISVLFDKVWNLLGYSNTRVNPLTAKLFNLNFHPLRTSSGWKFKLNNLAVRGLTLVLSENYSDLTKSRSTLFKSCWLMSHLIWISDCTHVCQVRHEWLTLYPVILITMLQS